MKSSSYKSNYTVDGNCEIHIIYTYCNNLYVCEVGGGPYGYFTPFIN